MAKVYLAPGHGLVAATGRVDPGAQDNNGVTEQAAGDRAARATERILLDRFEDVEVLRQPRGGPNFAGTRDEIDAYGPDAALELHHDWIRAPRGGFGFHPGEGIKREICIRLEDAYARAGLATRPHMRNLPGTQSQPGLYRADTAATVLWEIDRIGLYTSTHAEAIALGLADLLGLTLHAPPAGTDDPEEDPTKPDRGYITYGDSGSDRVRDWQGLLIDKGFGISAGATGNFLDQTRRATLQAYAAVGLTAADPSRPRVGQRSFDALRDYMPAPWAGKRIVARTQVRFYRRPGWHPSTPTAGVLDPGYGFRGGIHAKQQVGNGQQYQVSNTRGDRFWITASPRYVRLLDA